MDQDRRAEPGADVGRTRGKITELRVKCESKSLSQFGVQPVDLGVGLVQGEPGMEALDAEVVLLVEHHPDPVLDQQRGPRAHPPVAHPAPPAPCSPGAARAAAGGRSGPAGRAGTGWPGGAAPIPGRRAPPCPGSPPARSRSSAPGRRDRRDSGPAGSGSRARGGWPARSHPASRPRHPSGGSGRSFQHPQAVAQLGGQLEVFGLHGQPQLLAQRPTPARSTPRPPPPAPAPAPRSARPGGGSSRAAAAAGPGAGPRSVR